MPGCVALGHCKGDSLHAKETCQQQLARINGSHGIVFSPKGFASQSIPHASMGSHNQGQKGKTRDVSHHSTIPQSGREHCLSHMYLSKRMHGLFIGDANQGCLQGKRGNQRIARVMHGMCRRHHSNIMSRWGSVLVLEPIAALIS
eukprot:2100004-Amphidinium_carterae.1